MSTETVEFIVRDCGAVGFLPIIRVVDGRELYRGEHHRTWGHVIGPSSAMEAAWNAVTEAWENETTDNIKEFKNPPACLEGCP